MRPRVYRSMDEYVMTPEQKAEVWNKVLQSFDSYFPGPRLVRVKNMKYTDLEEFTIDEENNVVKYYLRPGTIIVDQEGNEYKVPNVPIESRSAMIMHFTPENLQRIAKVFQERFNDQEDLDHLMRLIEQLQK